MRSFLDKHATKLFYGSWLLLNLLQAWHTQLWDDEAYYWIYSHFLAWGYFDHPPMIAVLIKAGYGLFPDELGVRLFIVLLNTLTIYLIQRLLPRKNRNLFFAIMASLLLAQLGGYLAVPDIPLLFFIALFFVVYRHFISRNNLSSALLLGLSMALMLYSKYHGVLVIFFTLLSNLRLLRQPLAWLAVGTAVLLFSPHLYWQYAHGFPSLQYHLFERNSVAYNYSFSLEYLGGQLALAGPVTGWLLLWAGFRAKPVRLTEKALKYSLVGIYLFFLLNSFRGRIEANWTVPAFVGLIVMSHQYLAKHHSLRKLLFFSLPLSLGLMIAARWFMLSERPRSKLISKDEFHGNLSYTRALQSRAGQLPVVFLDSYQKPSKYWFYGGRPSLALNTTFYRRNNFNFWPIEDSLIGHSVYVVGPKGSFFHDSIPSSIYEEDGGAYVSDYFSFSRVMISGVQVVQADRRQVSLHVRVQCPAQYPALFRNPLYGSAPFYLALYDSRGDVSALLQGRQTLSSISSANSSLELEFPLNLAPGSYHGKLGIGSCIPGKPSLNSTGFEFRIEP